MKTHLVFIFTGLLLFCFIPASAMGPGGGGRMGGSMQKSGESMIQESPLVRAMLEINLSDE